MGATAWLVMLLTHPLEFRTLLQFYLYHEEKRDLTSIREHTTSGWDRESMRKCWHYLAQTSRSFVAVIKELDGDLARTICLFYLVLRGLDTIEDDMTLPDEKKQALLRNFHTSTITPGWNFDGCGPNEKDRDLLVEYHVVVEELNRLDPAYRHVILDICEKMENGMADFAHKAATTGSTYLECIADYDLYCHYVAGLVGEGLSRIFSASKKEAAWLGDQLELSNSMGLLLQKTNIIRDYREDVEDKRFFWPHEIWGQKVYGFSAMTDMIVPSERRQWVQSAMVLDALRHAVDALDYIRLIKNQTVFNFVSIPATMAMATLELCFMNPTMFDRNVKIRKAVAADLIMRSTNPREVAIIFREYTRKIHAKTVPRDPNFVRLSVACGKIEQWCEHHYPSFVQLGQGGQSFNTEDARTNVMLAEKRFDDETKKRRRIEDLRKQLEANGATGARANVDTYEQGSIMEVVLYVVGGLILILVMCVALIWGILHYSGEPGY
ncbi:farnesyl-diphosphate farnesyltransferase [Fistulina hepatica ATCC 64428]|uniref:Squalene synthase n=1 Tax=Fistulina hepatica ATCC 64428 TaxID=1128425 RepID=A0A0D7A769_9AGAR|nr:farnesyl-diphosphate farnesyltransferase [Fistulina hepatica ATCC 64428]